MISQSVVTADISQRYRCQRCNATTTLLFSRGALIPVTLGAHNYTDNKPVGCGGKIVYVPPSPVPTAGDVRAP